MGSKAIGDNTTSNQVALRVKQLRTTKGWSQEELVDRLAVHGYRVALPTIVNIESRRRRYVTIDEFLAFVAVFEVKHDDLLTGNCSACKGEPPAGYSCLTCGNRGV